MQLVRTVVTAAFKLLLIVANTNVTHFRIYFGTRAEEGVNELIRGSQSLTTDLE
jgi:hypothetical protein